MVVCQNRDYRYRCRIPALFSGTLGWYLTKVISTFGIRAAAFRLVIRQLGQRDPIIVYRNRDYCKDPGRRTKSWNRQLGQRDPMIVYRNRDYRKDPGRRTKSCNRESQQQHPRVVWNRDYRHRCRTFGVVGSFRSDTKLVRMQWWVSMIRFVVYWVLFSASECLLRIRCASRFYNPSRLVDGDV